jgi:hypothetical protein
MNAHPPSDPVSSPVSPAEWPTDLVCANWATGGSPGRRVFIIESHLVMRLGQLVERTLALRIALSFVGERRRQWHAEA